MKTTEILIAGFGGQGILFSGKFLAYKGLVEVVSACPTNWGMTPKQALEWVESDMLPYYPIGVFKDRSENGGDAE